MLKILKETCIKNVQIQQQRLGHRVRGKAPVFCRTIKERLDEINYKDELYSTRIDIGLPKEKASSIQINKIRAEHLKKNKNDKNLELMARSNQLKVDLEEVKKEWLNTLAPFQKKQIADHYGIFEHLYGEGYFLPLINLEISYESKDNYLMPVYTGNIIKPTEALEMPQVSYKSDDNTLWTLALTNLDGHLTENEKEYIHWLVVNIPGNYIEKGDTLVEYLHPIPLKGTGYHRYVYVLYKQDKRMNYDIPKVATKSPLESRTFLTRDWYQKHQEDITPAGLAFFQTDWDNTVKNYFHNVLKSKEPVYEYDFPAPYIRPQEWFPRRKPFDLYMDKYRDSKQINKEYLLRKLKDEDPFKKPAPPLKFPNAHPLPHSMPSWLKLHERKIRMNWGRINDIE